MNNIEIPTMRVGKYRGIRMDKLPNSYLRWVLAHPFDEEYLAYARKKVATNPTVAWNINVTRHAVDSFSLRFIDTWRTPRKVMGMQEGLGSYIARMAVEALKYGKDVTKHRRNDDEPVLLYKEIHFVFNDKKSEMRTLITVY